MQHYWNRWKREYLNELREYQRSGKEEDTRINVSDILLVEDPTLSHSHNKQIVWKLGPNGPFYGFMLRTKLY